VQDGDQPAVGREGGRHSLRGQLDAPLILGIGPEQGNALVGADCERFGALLRRGNIPEDHAGLGALAARGGHAQAIGGQNETRELSAVVTHDFHLALEPGRPFLAGRSVPEANGAGARAGSKVLPSAERLTVPPPTPPKLSLCFDSKRRKLLARRQVPQIGPGSPDARCRQCLAVACDGNRLDVSLPAGELPRVAGGQVPKMDEGVIAHRCQRLPVWCEGPR